MRTASLSEFHAAAFEFCAFASCLEPIRKGDLSVIRSLLLRLIFHVPAVREHPHGFDFQGAGLSAEDRTRACERFRTLPFDSYRLIFSPHDLGDEESVIAELSDDLADIYCDLAEGLDSWSGGHPEEACLDWAQSYSFHWHRHAVSALSAIEHHLTDNPSDQNVTERSHGEENEFPI